MSFGSGRDRDLVIVACAISAGIHAALAPEHFGEGTGAGLAFVGAAAVLAGFVATLTLRANAAALAGAIAVLAGLIGSYAVATASGLPLLHPEPEPMSGLAVATKVVELVGLVAASRLLWHDRSALLAPVLPRPKGTLT